MMQFKKVIILKNLNFFEVKRVVWTRKLEGNWNWRIL